MIWDGSIPDENTYTTLTLTRRPPIKIKDSEWLKKGEGRLEDHVFLVALEAMNNPDSFIIYGRKGDIRAGMLLDLASMSDGSLEKRWEDLYYWLSEVAREIEEPVLAQLCIQDFAAVPYSPPKP